MCLKEQMGRVALKACGLGNYLQVSTSLISDGSNSKYPLGPSLIPSGYAEGPLLGRGYPDSGDGMKKVDPFTGLISRAWLEPTNMFPKPGIKLILGEILAKVEQSRPKESSNGDVDNRVASRMITRMVAERSLYEDTVTMVPKVFTNGKNKSTAPVIVDYI